MDEAFTEAAYVLRRSSRISAQARPEAPAKRARKGASAAANGAAKSTKARKRTLKEDQEGEQDADAEREQEAKKAKLPSAEEIQAAADTAPTEGAKELPATTEPSSALTDTPKNIELGETLPSLVLKNEKGEDIDTASLATEKGVVLFLVPKADTPGCNSQACGFRDAWEEFGSVDYVVYCLSADSPATQTKWQTKKQLPYQLLSDPQRTLIGALGAAEGNKTKRSHFIFDKGGKLLDKKMPVKPVDSPRLALEFIKGLSD